MLPWELWLRRTEARVNRVFLRVFASLSELSVCSRSAEKSESSVPSELLPAFLWWEDTTRERLNQGDGNNIQYKQYITYDNIRFRECLTDQPSINTILSNRLRSRFDWLPGVQWPLLNHIDLIWKVNCSKYEQCSVIKWPHKWSVASSKV